MKPRLNTSEYVNTHGKEPKGRGSWWLEITASDDTGRFTTERYNERGTLTDAVKSAIRNMKQDVSGIKKFIEVKVLP